MTTLVSISPKYLPPHIDNKKHKQKRLLLVVFLLVVSLIMMAVWILFNQEEEVIEEVYPTYQVCDYDPKQQDAYFKERDQLEMQAFSDYLFYGESFSIYQNKYDQDIQDPFVGQTLQFRNVCTNTIHSFLMSDYLDNNVPIYELPVGFYEVVIQSNLDGFRLVYPDPIDEKFYTVTRDNKRLEVHLMADRMLFTDVYNQEPLLQDNELYVEIKEVDVNENIVDVVLDPAYNHADFGPLNKGAELSGFVGSDETYRFVQDVKKILEDHGLVVGLTRPNSELTVNTYGDTGRVHAAMSHKAKIMVEFYFESVEDRNLQGTSVYGSNYASLNFQEILIREFDRLNLPIFIGSRNQYGVFHTPFLREMDQHNLIRESGGLALGAGDFSDRSQTLNEFAIGNRYGVHTVSVNLLMTSNPNFLELYQNNYDQMVQASAQGILKYLRIKP